MKSTLSWGFWLGMLAAVFVLAADQTWTGQISDSACGASHAKMTAGHPATTDHDCTVACVRNGAKYVFVSGGKVYSISNQKLPLLAANAGKAVTLTGTMKGDSITVATVTPGK